MRRKMFKASAILVIVLSMIVAAPIALLAVQQGVDVPTPRNPIHTIRFVDHNNTFISEFHSISNGAFGAGMVVVPTLPSRLPYYVHVGWAQDIPPGGGIPNLASNHPAVLGGLSNIVITSATPVIITISPVFSPVHRVEFAQPVDASMGALADTPYFNINNGANVSTVFAPATNPATGYRFSHWEQEGNAPNILTNGVIDANVVLNNSQTRYVITLRPVFVQSPNHTVNVNGINGTATLYPNTFRQGTSFPASWSAVTLTPDVGYAAIGGSWYPALPVPGSLVAISEQHMATESNHVFTFAARPALTITFVVPAPHTLHQDSPALIYSAPQAGLPIGTTNVPITTAAIGYAFLYWEYDGSTFTNTQVADAPAEGQIFRAVFERIEPVPLLAPGQPTIIGVWLSWEAVENAVGYRIYINGVYRQSVAALTFDLAELNLAVGLYNVQVMAIGEGLFANSLLSPAVNFKVEPANHVPDDPAYESYESYAPYAPLVTQPLVIAIPVNDGQERATINVEDNQAVLILSNNAVSRIINNMEGCTIVFDLSAVEDVNTIAVSRQAWNRFATAPGKLEVEFKLPLGTITFDSSALNTVNDIVAGNQFIYVSLAMVEPNDMTTYQLNQIGENDLVFIIAVYAGTQAVRDFGGKLSIAVISDDNPLVRAWHLDNYGRLERLSTTIATVETNVVQQLGILEFTVGSMFYTYNGILNASVAAPFMDTVYNRVMVPIRTVAYALGLDVNWIPETRTVVIFTDNGIIYLPVGEPLPDDIGTPVIVDSRTFVPLRFIAEILGAKIGQDIEIQIVN